jgi:hypothetical protein
VTEVLVLTVVDTVDIEVVVTVAEVIVLVRTPGQIYCIRLCGSAVAPVAVE